MSDKLEENNVEHEDEHEVDEEVSEPESTGEETAEYDEADILPGIETFAKGVKKVAKRFKKAIKGKEASNATEIEQPIKIETPFYKMDHPQRGHALIFNHFKFAPQLGLKNRQGTDKDCKKLTNALKSHGFKVTVHDDSNTGDIDSILNITIQKDHSNCDCIVISILTHGARGDRLYAKNGHYSLSKVMDRFTAENCPSLAGKPKLFIVQACRGDDYDKGHKIATDSGRPRQEEDLFRIPNHADFFVTYATIPGYVSWRNPTDGSAFIQTWCRVLQSEDSYTTSILQLALMVGRTVALEFEAKTNEKSENFKQMPSFTIRLMKDLILSKKQNAEQKNAIGANNQQAEAMETN